MPSRQVKKREETVVTQVKDRRSRTKLCTPPPCLSPSPSASEDESGSEETESSSDQDPDGHLRRIDHIKSDEQYDDDNSEASLDYEPLDRKPPATPSTVKNEARRRTNANTSGRARPSQAWTEGEDMTVLRAMIVIGEKGVDWHELLDVLNAGRTNERTMKSLKQHWSNTLRKHLLTCEMKLGSPRKKKGEWTSDVELSPSKKRVKYTSVNGMEESED